MIKYASPDKSPQPLYEDDLPCMIAVRNEHLRLPNVLSHHRALGITRFLIVDNGSNDGTLEFLSEQPDVDLWQTSQPFSEAGLGVQWYNSLAETYGYGRWYLIIDADELLVYPGMERYDIRQFCKMLREINVVTIRAPLVDMYPGENILQRTYTPGDSLIQEAPFFDGKGYRYINAKNGGQVLTGGPRARIISRHGKPFYNILEKYPLRFWRRGETMNSIHAHRSANLKTIPVAALLHFKLLPDFKVKIDEAIQSGEHWKDSKEYREYDEALEHLATPYYKGSVRYESPESLVSAGIIRKLKLEKIQNKMNK